MFQFRRGVLFDFICTLIASIINVINVSGFKETVDPHTSTNNNEVD